MYDCSNVVSKLNRQPGVIVITTRAHMKSKCYSNKAVESEIRVYNYASLFRVTVLIIKMPRRTAVLPLTFINLDY